MSKRRSGGGLRTSIAASVFVVGSALVIFLTAGHGTPSVSIDRSSDAYRIGYSSIYLAKGAQARAIRHDPAYNPYLTMPTSEWVDFAEQRVRDSIDEANRECDPYSAGTGDWSDYGAGANQALQDIASEHEPRMHLDGTDPDCD
jgi:hypothetical protein